MIVFILHKPIHHGFDLEIQEIRKLSIEFDRKSLYLYYFMPLFEFGLLECPVFTNVHSNFIQP